MIFGTSRLWQTVGKSREQRREAFFYKRMEEEGRGCSEPKFIGEKWEFKVVVASPCCRWGQLAVASWGRKSSFFLWTMQAEKSGTCLQVLPSWLLDSNFELGFPNTSPRMSYSPGTCSFRNYSESLYCICKENMIWDLKIKSCLYQWQCSIDSCGYNNRVMYSNLNKLNIG